MDFMRILRSLEEFLFEAITWLVFYPRAFVKTLFRPLRVMNDAVSQLELPEEEQYQDSLSPPLFLILSLLIGRLFEMAVHLDPLQNAGAASRAFLASGENLIIVRALMFAALPLMFALQHLRRTRQPLDRIHLRGPLFAECYPAAVFCLIFNAGSLIVDHFPGIMAPGLLMIVFSTVWYCSLQVFRARRLGVSWPRAALGVATCLAAPAAIIFAAAAAITFAN